MYSVGAGCGVFDLSKKSAFQLILGLQLIAVGQLLNAAIYAAIGKDGVYYGFKLGVTVPWVSGFPFNMGVAHPQYLGATLSIFGVQLLLCTDELASNGWFFIGIMQAIQYLYMSIVESM